MTIFQTQNQALAVTLATCGVPFAQVSQPDPSTGQLVLVDSPFLNIYDAALLKRLGYQRRSLRDAAREAWQAGRPGLLVYNFQRTPVCERILKAYDRHSLSISQADTAGIPAPCVLNIDPEDAAKLCCQFVKNRKMFTEGWRTAVPYIAVHGAIHKDQEDGKTVVIGSFKLMSINAGSDLQKKVGM